MSFDVKTISVFERQAKKLKKKYPSLGSDLLNLIQKLKLNPDLGVPLGNQCYKLRMAISSKGKGKSGGARVITHIYLSEKTVYLLTIYDKAERNTVSTIELIQLLKNIK